MQEWSDPKRDASDADASNSTASGEVFDAEAIDAGPGRIEPSEAEAADAESSGSNGVDQYGGADQYGGVDQQEVESSHADTDATAAAVAEPAVMESTGSELTEAAEHSGVHDLVGAQARAPRGLGFWSVVLLGLGVGYLAANIVAGPTWIGDAAWLAGAAAIIVGLLWLVWRGRPSGRGWVRAVMALAAWSLTIVAAAALGLGTILAEGTLHAPGPVAGNCFLAMLTFWLGAWVLGHAERSRLRRQVGALTDVVADLQARLTEIDEWLADVDDQVTDVRDRVQSPGKRGDAVHGWPAARHRA